MPGLIRVGHRGAPALAPDNTLASFEAALAVGVDMIEFDVLPGRSGELFVAHDRRALHPGRSRTLVAALTHFTSPPFATMRLQLDVKRRGCEHRVLDALDATATRARAFISTGVRGVLPRFRALAPEIALGWTVPDIPAITALAGLRSTIGRPYLDRLPGRAAERIAGGAIDALVAHWNIVTPELVDAVRGAGGELYAWTVNDRGLIMRLAALGVTGVITNDPRLFAAIEHDPAL